jgi:hypothetical protein
MGRAPRFTLTIAASGSALAVALVLSGALALPAASAAPPSALPAASAARSPTLTISVPAKVRPNQRYQIVIRVTYNPRSMRKPYLVSFLQFSGAACQATAGAEFALGSKVVYDDYVGTIPAPRFTRTDNWRAGTLTGDRQVCAYLYRRRVSQRKASTPLVSTSRFFRNL